MKRLIGRLGAAFFMLGVTTSAFAGGTTTTNVPSSGTTAVLGFTCFSSDFCTAHVNVNNAGTEIFTSGNPGRIDPTGATTQPVSGTFWQATQPVSHAASSVALGSFVAGAMADGAITTLGTEADTATYTGSGSATAITLLKAIWTLENNALLPSGTLTSGTAPNAGIATICQYNTAAPTPSNGQTVGCQADSSGNLKVNVVAGSGNAAASATGSSVPSSADFAGVSVGGTLRGVTGVNSSGSVYSPQLDIASVNGATVNTGTGASSTGTMRVVTSTDSGVVLQAGTNLAGKVGIDQTTAGTTNAVSIAQIGANTVPVGNGVNTNTMRVTVASDNSAIAGVGAGATGSAPPANAVYDGAMSGGNLTGKIACNATAVYDASTSGQTQLVALSSGKVIYICGYTIFSAGTASVGLQYGTGTACATGTHNITPAFQLTAQTGVSDQSSEYRGLNAIASNELCINSTAGVAVQAIVYYTQF